MTLARRMEEIEKTVRNQRLLVEAGDLENFPHLTLIGGGRLPDPFCEERTKGAEAGKTDLQAYFRDRQMFLSQQLFCPLEARQRQVCVRRFAEGARELPHEMERRH